MHSFPQPIIALIDDDSDNHFLFQEAMLKTGFAAQFILFDSGMKFIEYVADRSNVVPQLIFLDINMPILSGKECIVPIKRHLYPYETPVIMLTSSSSKGDIEESYSLGADRYLVKPSGFNEMVEVLTELLTCFHNNTLLTEKHSFVI